MSGDNKLKPSERMKIQRQAMPAREGHQRSACFEEVNLGFDERLAVLEAQRCLECKDAKCISGCPVQIDIPGFVSRVAGGDLAGAADILLRDNALPGISGRVCPQEKQCEAQCVRGKGKGCSVAIGHLERFVADWARAHQNGRSPVAPKPTGFKVAVVGSGPAGLTAAGELARKGHAVTVFEALHEPGGVLVYGIPQFRLPKEIVKAEVESLTRLGVNIECNVVIGQTYTIDDLMTEEGYHAVFIANGAGLPVFLGIPGENLKGVYSANEYLTRVNLMRAWRDDAETPVLKVKHAVVVGGGNTAMDGVRTAKRLGAESATLVYRRSRTEMPARIEEVQHAEEEGIQFQMLTNPVEILGDENGWVRAIRCVRMELGEPDASGRRSPIPIPGSEFEIPCEVVIVAVGTRANPLLTQTTPDLKVNRKGYIEVDADGMTSKPGVFAGGDIVRGAATVILAMGDGKRAAAAIDRYLTAKRATQ
ncbi:MAG TPA: NADPH-dependent glutamate synthase [Phycisphaerae bacterium]|jgi:glutamate synthase (NADPH/NADH) small chain|nr:NADPH-dependent glutamate synthase [Phycisphaerae bacterium]HOB76554.1 NADPH-dependent glutamate synthase [Phycisphaerae bacterium]HOJ56377.1 NADPH-dependent glutamate synthase [Phycisphaerae bacterium]HOL26313.1 NADPH-dependent glutamate synthase [Phycisphaerae bacterium]HPP20731.1 NADPH-dependent glutamate synthase [Phycisphaerae bacterium]